MARRRRRRRPPRWNFPRMLERKYAAALPRIVVGPIERIVQEQIIPRLSSMVAANDQKTGRTDSIRSDGWPDEVALMRRLMTSSFDVTQTFVDRAASEIAVDLYQQNRNQWSKIQNAMIGTTIGTAEPWATDMLQGWVQANVSLITKMQQEAVTNIEGIVSRGMTNGLRVEEIAKDLRGDLGETAKAKRRARLIARDQVAKLNGAITKERQTAIGVRRYIWRTSDDERVRGNPGGKYPDSRPSHFAMDDKVCRWDDDSVYWNGERWAKRATINGPIGHPGSADFQCLPGDSKLNLATGAEVLYRRWYAGDMTEVVTDMGVTLRATPNHPVLTLRGWVPLGAVDLSDHVIEVREKAIGLPEHDINDRVPTFAEVFDAAAGVVSPRRCPGSASQFHGDGSDNEVDVVYTDRLLSGVSDTAAAQERCKVLLAIADAAIPDTFSALGESLKVFGGFGLAARRIMRGASKLHALLSTHGGHPDLVRIASGAWRDTLLAKVPDDDVARYSVLFRQLENGYARRESGGDAACRELYAIVRGASLACGRIMPTSAELSAKVVGIDRESPSDLLQENSLTQHASRIVQKRVGKFEGHVYNLQSVSGYYIANSCIVHNCRCIAEPILDEVLEGIDTI